MFEDREQEIAEAGAQARNMLEALPEEISITTWAERDAAREAISDIKGRRTALETWRKEVTAPIKKGIRAFESKVKPAIDAYAEVENRLRVACSNFLELEEAKKQEALQTMAETGIIPQVTAREGSRVMWELEVTDFAALPDEFKMVDTRALRACIKAVREGREIPGVVLKQRITEVVG